MFINRKDFLKKVCYTSACMCGFSSIALANKMDDENKPIQDTNQKLIQNWLSVILQNLNNEMDSDSIRKIIKTASKVHYDNLQMDNVLAEYEGDLDKFIQFLEKNWEWKVTFDKDKGVLVADENKNFCVCPIAEFNKEVDSSAICYCSEGFAETMFKKVTGKDVEAEVISSVRRGDASCKYEVRIS